MSMCQICISASIYIFLSNICQGCQYLFMCSNIFILHIYTILDSASEVCGVCLETKMALHAYEFLLIFMKMFQHIFLCQIYY